MCAVNEVLEQRRGNECDARLGYLSTHPHIISHTFEISPIVHIKIACLCWLKHARQCELWRLVGSTNYLIGHVPLVLLLSSVNVAIASSSTVRQHKGLPPSKQCADEKGRCFVETSLVKRFHII